MNLELCDNVLPLSVLSYLQVFGRKVKRLYVHLKVNRIEERGLGKKDLLLRKPQHFFSTKLEQNAELF